MRVFALLFALYFTVLGCLSCTEVEAYAEPTKTTTVQPATHNSPAPVSDWCSPLCQCHCCPGFALPQAPAVSFVAQLSLPKAVLRFNSWPAPAVPARTLATPWQPPQGA